MLNLLHVLFLIFGWIYNIKGLIVASLVISSLFMILLFICKIMDVKNSENEEIDLGWFVQIVVIVLSIVKLCIM